MLSAFDDTIIRHEKIKHTAIKRHAEACAVEAASQEQTVSMLQQKYDICSRAARNLRAEWDEIDSRIATLEGQLTHGGGSAQTDMELQQLYEQQAAVQSNLEEQV